MGGWGAVEVDFYSCLLLPVLDPSIFSATFNESKNNVIHSFHDHSLVGAQSFSEFHSELAGCSHSPWSAIQNGGSPVSVSANSLLALVTQQFSVELSVLLFWVTL